MYNLKERDEAVNYYEFRNRSGRSAGSVAEKDRLWSDLNRGHVSAPQREREYRDYASVNHGRDAYDYNNQGYETEAPEYRRVPIGRGYDAYQDSDIMPRIMPGSKKRAAKKGKLSLKVKTLIGVYLAIVAVVLTLILVNTIPSGGAAESNANSAYNGTEIPAEAFKSGDINPLSSSADTNESNKGAFDAICDWIENLGR